MSLMKTCRYCDVEKPLSEFPKDRNCKDGHRGKCKVCMNAWKREWYADMPEDKRKQYQTTAKQWKSDNPGKSRDFWIAWHAAKYGATGFHTVEEWEALCKRYDYACLGCEARDRPLTRDHVIPLSRGGSNGIDNIQPLCLPCNSGKKDRTIDYRGDE